MMILKPACKREFVTIPNSLLNDTRVSIETRGMIAHLLSKPKNWKIRPLPLAKALSRRGERNLGRKRLYRMFSEASEARYMARSATQRHQDDGSWGGYDYIVGMPDEVSAIVQRSDGAYTFVLPQCREAHALEACTRNDDENHKIQNHKSQKDINPPFHNLSPGCAGPPTACQDELGEREPAVRAAECFVWEDSKPFKEWARYWRQNGGSSHPPLINKTIGGKQIRGTWLPTLYPPDYRGPTGSRLGSAIAVGVDLGNDDAASADAASNDTGNANALIEMIMTTQECTRDEAAKIFASLPDADRG
jgi:hypothetical protein